MALRLRPREAIAQPQGFAEIDWSNELTQSLVALVKGDAQYNLVNGLKATTSTNQPTNTPSTFGIARTYIRATSSKDMYPVTGHTGDLTIIFVGCVFSAIAGTQNALVLATSGSSTKRIWFGEASTSRHVLTVQPSGGSAVTVAESSSTIGGDAVWVIRVSGTTISLWRNGVSQGSNTIASQNFSDAVEMNLGWTGFLENPNARMFLQGYWKRALSDDEISTLSGNPWQLFRDDILIDIAAASGNATANGAVLDAVASLIAGTATGEVNATANGVVLDAVASFIAGTATGAGNATASGVILDAIASFIAGSATGEVNATASGVVLDAVASFLAGAASGGTNATANGAVLDAIATLLPGSATGEINAIASGAIFSAIATLLGGSASGNVVSGTTNFGKLHISISISI